jgi:tetratricopeptide (TPR) repeat protein
MCAVVRTFFQVLWTAIAGVAIGVILALVLGFMPQLGHASDDPVASAIEQAGVLWPQRDQQDHAVAAIALLERAKAIQPDHYGVRWQLARFLHWQALDGPSRQKVDLGRRCWAEAKAATHLRPDGVEGHYWAAACVGTYGQGVSKARAIFEGIPDAFEAAAHIAIQLDATHDRGGPLRALGRYYTTLPWPYRDLDKAKLWLNKAIDVDGRSPANLYFLADMAQRSGDTATATDALGRLLSLPASGDDPARVRLYQAKAQRLLAEMG